jgi:hypothetical protein
MDILRKSMKSTVKTGPNLTPVKVVQVSTYMVLCLLKYTLKPFFQNSEFTTYSDPNEWQQKYSTMSQGNKRTILYIPTMCYKHQTETDRNNYLIKHIITSDWCRNCCRCFCTLQKKKKKTYTLTPIDGD